MLSFTLLGQVSLHKNGVPLKQFRSQKEVALLIYLAQTGQSQQRDFIADLLWDSRSTKQALSNLRTVLTRLRKQVGEALVVSRKSLSLASESQQQVDTVILLQTLSNLKEVDSAEKANTLQKVLNTYHGDFLPDFHLPDAPRFDAWVITTREHIRRQVIGTYKKLGQYALSTGDIERGIDTTHRWLQLDVLDEMAHTLLIQLLLEGGQAPQAVSHYNYYVDLLRTEMGVVPSAEITALLKEISQPSVVVLNRPSTSVYHNLPAQHDQFFGRITAQNDIHARLDQPWCRLATLVGPGGVGKTRLATTIARSRLSQYQDGVWLVELAEIDPDDTDLAEAIVVEIASACDLRLSGSEKLAEQLFDHLQHKQMLLVLDNFEHLIEGGVQLVLNIIQRCERVQLLVTSREALQIRAEWTIALTGLGYPRGDEDAMASDAVDLFAARQAQQWRGAILADDLTDIRRICQLVEGLPLAIELAAALTHHMTTREIADELRDGFDTLKTSLRDVPQRHRSLQFVFEMSWRTLTPTLQQKLAHLSVFRGGFTETAAQHIASVDAQDLAALGNKSLLLHDAATGRYTFHAVVRSFAAQKRASTDQTPQKHAHYYLTLLAQHAEPLQKNAPQQSIAKIEPDIANVRLAWETGLAGHQADLRSAADLLSAALTSLSIYYQLRGLAHEAEAVMQTTLRTATAWESDGIVLATRAGLEQARFQIRLGRYRPAIQTIDTALKLADRCEDRWADGMGHVLWGEALWRLGEYDAAESKLTHALTIARALDAILITGWCHHHLGVINDIQSRYDSAYDHLQQACVAWRTIDNAQALSNSLNSIGLVCYHQGDLSSAQQAMEEVLPLFDQLDNRHLKSVLLNNLSIVFIEQSDFMSAHHYLQLGLELATGSGNLTSQGEIYSNLGENYRLLGKLESAVESLEQGLRISEAIGNRSLMVEIMVHLAETKRKQDDLIQAESWYSQALEIARQDSIRRTEYEALIGLAELSSKTDTERARQFSMEAIGLAEAMQNAQFLERANAIDRYLNVSVDVDDENLCG